MKKNSSQLGQVQEKAIFSYSYEWQVEVQRRSRPVRERKHFSHRHPLQPCEVPKEDEITCAICEAALCGPAYGCTTCSFFIHKSCFDIPREIQHKAHPQHPLTLLSSPSYKSGGFSCDACGKCGSAFHYHCVPCQYDLHVACAASPKTVYREDHEYPLNLYYAFPHKNEASPIYCDVCDKIVGKNHWVYYNRNSDYICHLYCATDEESDEELQDSILAIQDQLQALKTK
uniref:DC1 domain-containing protein n=1 Tax=Davidia involucrata TaxID=16924 RepID=A0A5B6ZCU8_DAVIN